MNRNIMKYAAVATVAASLLMPAVALAQLKLPSLGGEVSGGGGGLTASRLLDLMRQFSNFLVTASIIIAVIVIVYGGIMWMYKGDAEGKKILTKGIIGVAIVLAVGVILQTVARIVQTQQLG